MLATGRKKSEMDPKLLAGQIRKRHEGRDGDQKNRKTGAGRPEPEELEEASQLEDFSPDTSVPSLNAITTTHFFLHFLSPSRTLSSILSISVVSPLTTLFLPSLLSSLHGVPYKCSQTLATLFGDLKFLLPFCHVLSNFSPLDASLDSSISSSLWELWLPRCTRSHCQPGYTACVVLVVSVESGEFW